MVVNETLQPGMSISYVARRHGLSPSLVFRWRRLMSKRSKEAVRADEDVVAASEVRRLEERVRDSNACSAARPWRSRSSRKALPCAGKKPTLLSRSHAPEDTPLHLLSRRMAGLCLASLTWLYHCYQPAKPDPKTSFCMIVIALSFKVSPVLGAILSRSQPATPFTIGLPPRLEAADAFPGAKGRSPGVIADQPALSAASPY
ncbi:transposase [Bradyrhizobium jicamae]|uniref:transposase n=1 Tax=Bradyrhizobium jicamae TaxID=280332 RepID=UPI0012EEBC0E